MVFIQQAILPTMQAIEHQKSLWACPTTSPTAPCTVFCVLCPIECHVKGFFVNQYLIAASASMLMGAASAENPNSGITINAVGTTPTIVGAAPSFSGSVSVDIKSAGNSSDFGSVGLVQFMPGARTAWHSHPAGQLLIITDGQGWVQQEGQPARTIKAGDVVWIAPGIKHWHGATQDKRMSHYAVAYQKDGVSTDWKEAVSDAQYPSR